MDAPLLFPESPVEHHGGVMSIAGSITGQVVQIPDVIEVSNNFDVQTITAIDLIFAATALIAGFILSRVAKRTLLRVFGNLDGMPVGAGAMIARFTGYFIALIGLFVAVESLGFSWGPLGSLLILILIVLFFAAKPLLEDLGAGLVLQVRQPFKDGDLVDLQNERGVVEEVNARTVMLTTVDGRRVHLPSRNVLSSTITNLTAEGSRLTSFVAGVDYNTDLDRARAFAVEAMSAAPGVLADPPPEALVEEFGDSTINISCRIWHEPDVMSELRALDEAMRAVKRHFDANGIVIAFPQRVLWRADNDEE
jgi:small conductance mechanosensitive channel